MTVWKITLDNEPAAEYGIDGLTTCPMLKADQIFDADDEAWKAVYRSVFAPAHGAGKEQFDYGD